jgi:hypothetical protein
MKLKVTLDIGLIGCRREAVSIDWEIKSAKEAAK